MSKDKTIEKFRKKFCYDEASIKMMYHECQNPKKLAEDLEDFILKALEQKEKEVREEKAIIVSKKVAKETYKEMEAIFKAEIRADIKNYFNEIIRIRKGLGAKNNDLPLEDVLKAILNLLK